MNTALKNTFLAVLLPGLISFGASQATAETIQQKVIAKGVKRIASTVAKASKGTLIEYPTTEAPLFSIKVPENWKLTPANTADEFFLVADPAGEEMWFRASKIVSEKDLEAVISAATKSGEEWLAQRYAEVKFGVATKSERKGMPFISLTGAGVTKEAKKVVDFTSGFFLMPNGTLAEFWGIVPKSDRQGLYHAQKVLDSFEPK
jgi:hypothetical protein